MEYEKLKSQLEMFQSTAQQANDKVLQDQTMDCSRRLIQQYIKNGLHSGIEAGQIKSDMEKLCRFHFVIPQHWLQWVIKDVDDISDKLTQELQKVSKPIAQQKHHVPSLFSKETLYHASICCEAINDVSHSNPLSFFQTKNPHHSLSEVSFSQNRDGITPYLIARQNDVLYVAFQGTQEVSKWLKHSSSFNEGNYQPTHFSCGFYTGLY